MTIEKNFESLNSNSNTSEEKKVTLTDIFESLNNNSNITLEGKEAIETLLLKITNAYPDIDLNNLNSKISTLEFVEEGGKYSFNGVINYNPNANKISFSEKKIEQYDQKNLLTNVLIKLCFSNQKNFKENEENYEALYEGTIAQMANMLVGNDKEKVFNQEELYEANLISAIVGFDAVEHAFKTKDYSELSKIIGIKDICDKMTYSYIKKINQKSADETNFKKVEQNLIDLLFSEKRDSSQISFFEMNLVDNKNYMNNPEYYTDLDDLHEFYFNKKNMYIQKFYPQKFGINEQAKVK